MVVPIGSLTEPVQTWNPSREPKAEFTYIDLSAVDNAEKKIAGAAQILGSEAPSRARQLVSNGDVLVSTVRPNLNAVATVPPAFDGSTASTGFTVLRPGAKLDGRYLFHWVRSLAFVSDMVRKATGASYPAVSDRIVRESLIPFRPLEEQRRIAAILDRADAVRAKRRQVLAHLDSLPQAIFRDMFGKVRGTITHLGEVADFYGGTSLPEGLGFAGQPDGVLLMKVSDMNSPGNDEEIRSTALWTGAATTRSSTVDAGAVILPKRGASIATNKKRLTTRKTALDPNLMGVQPRPARLNNRYLLEWFKSFDLATITSGSTVPQLNKQDLAPLSLLVPPLEHQQEFSRMVGQIRGERRLVERALAADDELFASVQTRAFRGEL